MIEEYVKAGAAFLDEKIPEWAEKINVATLRMDSRSQCILGQLYGRYDAGLLCLGLLNKRVEYGFHPTLSGFDDDELWSNGTVDKLWKEEIARRAKNV